MVLFGVDISLQLYVCDGVFYSTLLICLTFLRLKVGTVAPLTDRCYS